MMSEGKKFFGACGICTCSLRNNGRWSVPLRQMLTKLNAISQTQLPSRGGVVRQGIGRRTCPGTYATPTGNRYSKYSLRAHSLQAQPRYRHQNPRVPTFPRQNVFVTGTPRYRHKKNHFVPITSCDVIQNADVSGHWGGE